MSKYTSLTGNSKKGKAFWGPMIWGTMHSMAISYSPTPVNKKAFIDFLNSLLFLLPCKECRKHFIDTISSNPITEDILSSAKKLFLWTVSIHNTVNLRLGKPVWNNSDAERHWVSKVINDE